MFYFKKSLCLFTLILLNNVVYADIVGSYECKVSDPAKDKTIDEHLTIAKTEEVYRFEYIENRNPTVTILGTGLLNENALASIAWDPTSKWVIVTLFQVKPDGSLEGNWAKLNSDTTRKITCKKI